MYMDLKDALYQHLAALLQVKIAELKQAIDDTQASANSEEKSSAGDKYETGRAMAQNTRDMYAKQYQLALHDSQLLENLSLQKASAEQVHVGSLVHTGLATYWIGLSMGKVAVHDTTVLCLSAASPLGKELLGKKVGESFLFLGKAITILTIS